MKVIIKADEVAQFIQRRYGKTVSVECVDHRTLRFGFEMEKQLAAFLPPVKVSMHVAVIIAGVEGRSVVLVHDANKLVVGALNLWLNTRPDIQQILTLDGNKAVVNLDAIREAGKAFDIVGLKEIKVNPEDSSIVVEIELVAG